MNTNNKKVNTKIRKYIIDSIDLTDYAEKYENSIVAVYKIFTEEYGFMVFNVGLYDAFKGWMQGLPSCLNFAFCYCEQRQILRDWLEQSEEESEKYEDCDVCKLFYNLITREFFNMVIEHEKSKDTK